MVLVKFNLGRLPMVALACLMVTVASMPVDPVMADSAVVMSTIDEAAKLPTPRYRTSAILNPETGKAYVIGGFHCPTFPTCVRLHEILEYAPWAGSVSVAASMGGGISDTSAAWGGSAGYIFGGVRNFSILSDAIYRFIPSVGSFPATLTWMGGVDANVKLPGPRWGTSAIWTGNEFFIFGGYGTPEGGGFNRYLDEIVKYTPGVGGVDAVTVMGAPSGLPGEGRLPTARSSTSAVWDPRDRPADGCTGGCAYIFGGYTTSESTIETTQIVKYNPATNKAIILTNAFLPTPRAYTSAVWDGKYAYIFGGGTCCVRFNDVVRYDPEDGSVVTMTAVLSTGQASTSAVWGGEEAYVFGGYSSITGWTGSDEIIRYTIEPGPPTLTTSRGPERGEVTLSWTPPAANTYSPKTADLTGYQIFWSSTPGTGYGTTPNATVGNVLSYVATGLADGETRYYKVRALASGIESPRIGVFSQEVAGRAPSAPSAPFPFKVTPGVESIEITWGLPSDNGGAPIASFSLYRRSALHGEPPAGNYALLATLGDTARRYIDTTCPATMVCYYRLTATNLVGLEGEPAEGEAPGTTAGFFAESFPASGTPPGWSLDPYTDSTRSLWHIGSSSDPSRQSCRYASPPHSLAYNFPGCPSPPSQPNFNAGTTYGNATTPLIGIPANQRLVSLTYSSWYQTETLRPSSHDLKRVFIKNATDAGWHMLLKEQGPDRTWMLHTLDITAWQGNSVYVRFSFDSVDENANDGEGWYIDDVRVVGIAQNV